MERGAATFDVNALPTEILEKILVQLDGATFVRARTVCQRWRDIADLLARDEQLWRRFTLRDFDRELFRDTLRCRPTMSWRDVYRSLHLWPRFAEANYQQQTLMNHSARIVFSLKLFSDKIVLLTDSGIHFYSPDYTPLRSISGEYLDYAESELARALLDFDGKLYVYEKDSSEPLIIISNVSSVCVLEDNVFVRTYSGLSCYRNGVKTFSTERRTVGQLSCDGQYVYARVFPGSFDSSLDYFEMSIKCEILAIVKPFSCQQFAGILATYPDNPCVESFDSSDVYMIRGFLNHSFKDNINFINNPNASLKSLEEHFSPKTCNYIICATVYNNTLFVGTTREEVCIVSIEGFKIIRSLNIGNQIRSLQVTETARVVTLWVHTLGYVSVITFKK